MAINNDVYGASDSWYYSPAFNSTLTTFFNNNYALLNAFKATPPKTVNFGGTDNSEKGMLSRGISENKTPANVAIDNSIVAIGQDAAVSPFGKMKCVQFVSRNGWTPTREITEIVKTAPINVFFATWQGASSYYDNMTAWAFRVDSNANSIWAPNSNATNNPNMRVFPIASYGAKSLLLTPMVFSTTNDIGGAQNGNWHTLNQWRDNYSNEYVYAIALKVQVVNSITATTIGYGSTGFSTTQRITAALWDSIGDSDNTHIDYCFTYDTITATGNMLFLMKYFGYNSPVVQNQITTHWQGYFPNVDLFDHCEFKQSWSLTTSAIEIVRWGYKIGYSDNNYNVIMKWAALFGAPFTPTGKTSFGTMFNDSDLYFPIIDNNGIAHGEYTHGTDNLTNPFNDKTSTRDYDYSPTANIDTNTYSNTTDFRTVQLVSGTNQYVVDIIGVNALMTKLYDIFAGWSDVTYAEVMGKVTADFLVSEPLQSIVSLYAFPFTPPHPDTTTTVKLGNNDTGIQAYKLTKMTEMLTFAGIDTIYPRFGDCFLDYEPYTRYEVYVPFCGTVKLNAADILGHKLNVKMAVDLVTGVCTGYILADNLCIETVTGTCGVQLPISGLDTATINANIVSANIRQKSADSAAMSTMLSTLTPSGLGAAVSNPFSFADKLQQSELALQQANYDVSHIPANPHSIGSASPLTGWCSDLSARLIIYYPTGDAIDSGNPPDTLPKLKDLTSYGRTTGFATLDINTLSNYSGFTQVSNIDLTGITATESELNEIRTLLQSGVYV